MHVCFEEAGQRIELCVGLHQPDFRSRKEVVGAGPWRGITGDRDRVMKNCTVWHLTLRNTSERGFKVLIWGFISILTTSVWLNTDYLMHWYRVFLCPSTEAQNSITEQLNSKGMWGHPLAQPPAQSRWRQTGCSGLCPFQFYTSL